MKLRTKKRWIVSLCFSITVFIIGVVAYNYLFIFRPIHLDKQYTLEMTSGMTLRQIANRLHQQNLIHSPVLFMMWAKALGLEDKLQAGTYAVHDGDTPLQILDKMAQGDVLVYQFTIISGMNVRQLLDSLQAAPGIRKTIATSVDLSKKLDLTHHSEGLFYPDTYQYPAGSTDLELLQRAHQQQHSLLNNIWQEAKTPLKSAYELVIVASIIEKESAIASERPLIASVIYNRLAKGMRLQMDPTVIYALGPHFVPPLLRKDLAIDSPYNTYRVKGLPPTPIAIPSIASLYAAAHPAQTNYYYFVAKGNGYHQFSTTLTEQSMAIRRYRHKPLSASPGSRSDGLTKEQS